MAQKIITGFNQFQKSVAGSISDQLGPSSSIGDTSKVCARLWKEIGVEARENWAAVATKATDLPKKCTSCPRVFKREKDLKYHEKHCGEEHKCEECGKIFSAIENLNRHRKIHTSPCQCPDCGKCFGTLTMLSRHMAKHSGSRQHSCTECDSKFTLPSNLKKHVKKYHSK